MSRESEKPLTIKQRQELLLKLHSTQNSSNTKTHKGGVGVSYIARMAELHKSVEAQDFYVPKALESDLNSKKHVLRAITKGHLFASNESFSLPQTISPTKQNIPVISDGSLTETSEENIIAKPSLLNNISGKDRRTSNSHLQTYQIFLNIQEQDHAALAENLIALKDKTKLKIKSLVTINKKTFHFTPLQYTAYICYSEGMKLLLEHGADFSEIHNKDKELVSWLTDFSKHEKITKILELCNDRIGKIAIAEIKSLITNARNMPVTYKVSLASDCCHYSPISWAAHLGEWDLFKRMITDLPSLVEIKQDQLSMDKFKLLNQQIRNILAVCAWKNCYNEIEFFLKDLQTKNFIQVNARNIQAITSELRIYNIFLNDLFKAFNTIMLSHLKVIKTTNEKKRENTQSELLNKVFNNLSKMSDPVLQIIKINIPFKCSKSDQEYLKPKLQEIIHDQSRSVSIKDSLRKHYGLLNEWLNGASDETDPTLPSFAELILNSLLKQVRLLCKEYFQDIMATAIKFYQYSDELLVELPDEKTPVRRLSQVNTDLIKDTDTSPVRKTKEKLYRTLSYGDLSLAALTSQRKHSSGDIDTSPTTTIQNSASRSPVREDVKME